MIDLYAAPTSNGLRARIMLEESGLPYELHVVDLTKGEHRSPEFLAMNPDGLIPVMVDRDGPGGASVTLPQSMAIQLYVAEKIGRFMPADPAERAAFWPVLMNASTDVGPALSAVFSVVRSDNPRSPSLGLFETKFKNHMTVWDKMLGDRRYCAGDEVTIADFSLYPVFLRCQQVTPALAEGFPNVDRWAGEIGARPAVARGVKFD